MAEEKEQKAQEPRDQQLQEKRHEGQELPTVREPSAEPQQKRPDHGRRESFLAEHPIRASQNTQFLSDDEVKKFIDDLDHNGDGYIDYSEVESKLDHAHNELTPKPSSHHVVKKDHGAHDEQARHEFLRTIMGGTDAQRVHRDEFARLVHEWKIPSLKEAQKQEQDEKDYLKRLPKRRRVQAYWAVHDNEIFFIGLVVALQLALGIWQLVKYQTTPGYREAFGWGVVMAKAFAGASYPTWFFLILSMSRYFSTWLRRSYHISRVFNWDLSQEFHIRVSCVALFFATMHAIGHLTGSFVAGSDPAREDAVAAALGPDSVPRPYINYVRSVPGFTGITALGLFYVLALMSMPQVRRWNYQVFQLGHLLMYPIIGLLMAHGSAALLQWPMLGYFLAFPTLLVLIERSIRIFRGFHRIKATVRVLDKDTVEISAVIPKERLWSYKAGQYIFLQVPQISLFQWHPFTVSFCRGNRMMLHIKIDGDWTGKLGKLGGESGESEIDVGIDGPYGAPAQRFYDFSHSIIIGAGIGVTPFSGILADLQFHDDIDHGGPSSKLPKKDPTLATSHSERKDLEDALKEGPHIHNNGNGDGLLSPPGPAPATSNPNLISKNRPPQPGDSHTFADDYRRVDFHWMVRERNYLQWFSDLLNEVSRSQEWHRSNESEPHLDIRINTHVTAKRKEITTHVYRWLLEMHRTDSHPASPITGLLNPTHFGRPDFDTILDEHYEDTRRFRASKRAQGRLGEGSSSGESEDDEEELKVGVFYCGAPVVGEILADKCRELTTRGRHDGSYIEYHFMLEVFG